MATDESDYLNCTLLLPKAPNIENAGGISEKESNARGGGDKGTAEKEPLLSDSVSPAPDTEDATTSVIHVDIDTNDMSSKKKGMTLDLPSVVRQAQHHSTIDIDRPGPLLHNQLSTGPLKIAVFIKTADQKAEGKARLLTLEKKGRSTTAADIKDEMLDLLSIPKSSAHMFAIWFISPYLELQLKSHHVPFYLRKQWKDLLKKLTNCPMEEQSEDEPVLVFQRNSFITVAEEQKETENNVLKRLFEEASYNVLKARYPVPIDVAERLGGILLRCYEGEFDAEKHKPGFFKKRLNEFLPYYAIGSNKISQYIYSSGAEQRLLQQYESASKDLGDKLACYQKYLEECRNLEFYGCAFFKGTCYQEGIDYKIWKSEEQPITIGLNRHGITLFKGETEEVLTHLVYSEFSWNFIRGNDELDDDGNPIERFIIEYDEDDGTRQIQIISKQSCLMDAMVSSCAKFLDEVGHESKGTISRKKIHNISYRSTNKRAVEA